MKQTAASLHPDRLKRWAAPANTTKQNSIFKNVSSHVWETTCFKKVRVAALKSFLHTTANAQITYNISSMSAQINFTTTYETYDGDVITATRKLKLEGGRVDGGATLKYKSALTQDTNLGKGTNEKVPYICIYVCVCLVSIPI